MLIGFYGQCVMVMGTIWANLLYTITWPYIILLITHWAKKQFIFKMVCFVLHTCNLIILSAPLNITRHSSKSLGHLLSITINSHLSYTKWLWQYQYTSCRTEKMTTSSLKSCGQEKQWRKWNFLRNKNTKWTAHQTNT